MTLLLFYSTCYSQVIIQGQIENYDGKSKVYYSPTVDGINAAYDNSSEELQPDARGRFTIEYESKGIGSTVVGFAGLTYSFIHDESARIKFTIDQSKINIRTNRQIRGLSRDSVRHSTKQAATVSIEGDYARINRFNNRMMRSSTIAFRVEGCDYSKLIQRARTPHETISILDSLTRIELDEISKLTMALTSEDLPKNRVTPEMRRFLETQVYSFYGTVFLEGMMLKRFDQAKLLSERPGADYTSYNRQWEELIERFFLKASQNISPLPASDEYNEFILSSQYTLENYKNYHWGTDETSNDKLIVERLVMPLGRLDSLDLVNDKAVFAYRIHHLSTFLDMQTFYSPVLLNAVNSLIKKYPGSNLISRYQQKIDLLQAYLKDSAKRFDKFQIVNKNFLQFGDLLQMFKGKNLLIDIWATWCAPCIEDFNYKGLLTPFIKDGRLSILYISIDKPRWENRWKQNIKFNELQGYHVLADNVLVRDIWKELGGPEGLIPRYALIDKHGLIYLKNAARPSDSDTLIRQIKSLLETQ